jgi:hypothetical protein
VPNETLRIAAVGRLRVLLAGFALMPPKYSSLVTAPLSDEGRPATGEGSELLLSPPKKVAPWTGSSPWAMDGEEAAEGGPEPGMVSLV